MLPLASAELLIALSGGPAIPISIAVYYIHSQAYKNSDGYKDFTDNALDNIIDADYGSYYKTMKDMKKWGYTYSNKDGYFVKLN